MCNYYLLYVESKIDERYYFTDDEEDITEEGVFE